MLNMVAEGRALVDGLQLARQLHLHKVLIESDSQVLVNWLKSGICTFWYMLDFWEEIKEIFWILECSLSHIFREANMVADHLVKERANGRIRIITSKNVGPGTLRGLLWIDAWELPYLRLKSFL